MQPANSYIARWTHCSATEILERAVFIADNDPAASFPCIVEACMIMLPQRHPVDATTLRAFAALFKRLGLAHSAVAPILLEHISVLPEPLAFVDILPSIIHSNSLLVTSAFHKLRSILLSDETLTLPILNILVDLPLSPEQKHDVTLIMEDALSSIDEGDLPFLVRSLLKTLMLSPNSYTVARIRYELKHISLGTLAVTIESLWELVPLSAKIASTFAQDILRSPDSNTSLSDVSILLVLFQCQSSVKAKAVTVCERWLAAKKFPFEAMMTIISIRQRSEVWSKVLSAIWDVCMWMLDTCSQSEWYMLPPHCWISIKMLTQSLCNNSIELRDTIVKVLLQRTRNCLPSTISHNSLLPSTAESFGIRDKSHQFDTLASHRQAAYSADILFSLVSVELNIGPVVLDYIMQKLHATTSDTVDFPPLRSLHRLLQCVILSSSHMRAMENTLIIVIQKLLCATNMTQHSKFNAIVSASTSEQRYHISTIGILLAAHLITRQEAPLPSADLLVLLSSIVNAITTKHHDNIVAILDALCVSFDCIAQRRDIAAMNKDSLLQHISRAFTKFVEAYKSYCWLDNHALSSVERVGCITRLSIASNEAQVTWNVHGIAEEALLRLQNPHLMSTENFFGILQQASTLHHQLLTYQNQPFSLRMLCAQTNMATGDKLYEIDESELSDCWCEVDNFMSDEAFRLRIKKLPAHWQDALQRALELSLIATLHQSYYPTDAGYALTVLRYVAAARYYLRRAEIGINISFSSKSSSNGKRSSGDEGPVSDGRKGSGSDAADSVSRKADLLSYVSEMRENLSNIVLLLPETVLLRIITQYADINGLAKLLTTDGVNCLLATYQHALSSWQATATTDVHSSFFSIKMATSLPSVTSTSVSSPQHKELYLCSIVNLFACVPVLLTAAGFARECNDNALAQLLPNSDIDYETCRYCILHILTLTSHALVYQSVNSGNMLDQLGDCLRNRYAVLPANVAWLKDMMIGSNKFLIVLMLERCINIALDSSIILVCVQLLLTLSSLNNDCLHERVSLTAWQAMLRVHGSPTNSLFPLRNSAVMHSVVSATMLQLNNITQASCAGLQRCEPLFRDALTLSTKSRASTAKTSFQLIESESYDSFRLLCSVWWSYADSCVVANGLAVLILEALSVASLGCIQTESNDDIRRSGRRKRAKVAQDNGSMPTVPSISLHQEHRIAHRIDETNATKYLLFGLSLLPALMQMIQPSSTDRDPDADGVGPYFSLKLCLQVMVCTINEVDKMQRLPHGSHMLVELAPKLLRIIKSFLFGMQHALQSSVTWRNDHEDSSVCDLDFLVRLLQHALAVISAASNFASMLTQLMLHRTSHGLPSNLQSSLPQLQIYIEKCRAFVGQIYRSHQMEISSGADMDTKWILQQHSSSVDYINRAVRDEMNSVNEIVSCERSIEAPVRRKYVEVDEPAGFIVESAHNGWGLYDDVLLGQDDLYDDDVNSMSFMGGDAKDI